MDTSVTPEMMYDPFTSTRENFIRYRLIPALRSSNYKQIRGTLRKDNGFCCIGVACDLLGVAWDNTIYGPRYAAISKEFSFSFDTLPDDIAKRLNVTPVLSIRAEVADLLPQISFPRFTATGVPATAFSLAGLNDIGFTFKQIADILEVALDNALLMGYDDNYDEHYYPATYELSQELDRKESLATT